jgi:hypothetical protein
MPSDIEMGDSDSSILDTEITLDPEIIAGRLATQSFRNGAKWIWPEICKTRLIASARRLANRSVG